MTLMRDKLLAAGFSEPQPEVVPYVKQPRTIFRTPEQDEGIRTLKEYFLLELVKLQLTAPNDGLIETYLFKQVKHDLTDMLDMIENELE